MKQAIVFRPRKYSCHGLNLNTASGTASVLLATPSIDDSVCKSIQITSTDTVARDITLIIVKGSSSYVIGTVAVPSGAGTASSSPSVDALAIVGLPEDATGKKVLPLDGETVLHVQSTSAITSGKVVCVLANLEDF